MPHIHEQNDFVVSAFIVHEDKVLLVNHPRYNKWLCPGGHIELDEDPDQALMREIEEETGLEVEILAERSAVEEPGVKPLYRPEFVDIHDANPPHKHIALCYLARAKNNLHVKSDEHDDMRWFSLKDLDDPKYNMTESLKYYSREAIKRVGELS